MPSFNDQQTMRTDAALQVAAGVSPTEEEPTPPEEITLDLDVTDDPVHGQQEGRFFHGFCRRKMLRWCEKNDVFYCVGACRNKVLDLDENSTQMLQSSDVKIFEWQDTTDGDHGEHIGYDRKTGRCNYQYHRF